jgi:DNA-binding transcriptional ArsR family regulator
MAYPRNELLALSNETRAKILQRLESGPLAVSEIANGLPMTRPAVSQHLRILEQAGLVAEEYQGTRHIYRVDPAGLVALRAWLDRFWTRSLDAFAQEVNRQTKEPTTDAGRRRDSRK